MVKKSLALGVLATSLAAPSMAQPCYFKSGFLAGAHVGVSNGSGRFNSTLTIPALNFGTVTNSAKARKNSAMFGVIGGYRHIFHEGYTLGLDLTVNIFSNDNLNKLISATYPGRAPTPPFLNVLARRLSAIPSIKLGTVLCSRWHVAVGLGLGISKFHQKMISPFPAELKRPSTTKLGFVPSLGVEYAATQNISVVGNVEYEIYKKISHTFSQQFTSPIAGSSYILSISPRYLTLRVGAVYRF